VKHAVRLPWFSGDDVLRPRKSRRSRSILAGLILTHGRPCMRVVHMPYPVSLARWSIRPIARALWALHCLTVTAPRSLPLWLCLSLLLPCRMAGSGPAAVPHVCSAHV
jgi:hypothetical protein